MKRFFPLAIFTFISAAMLAQSPALKVQKYVLDNGFTVYLNEDKTAKETFGAVVVKAGSKNDPADATGMAHYQEHLLFKGTTEFGTLNYEKEKPFLDSINIYYDLLGKTKDEAERKHIQQLINNQSLQASKYGLPTEFDKLVKSIGGTNMNAFTQSDMTVYFNAFPGEQIEKWLDLYSSRFQHPVFRSFQSELEVVYEEKNKSMDNFQFKLFEEVSKNLYKYHPYGTQTTIGTVEHLKNPSLTKMYEFFNTYYVANNMALVLCGNFDAEKVLPLIKEKFSKLRSATVPPFPKYAETVFKKKEVLKVRYTPIKVDLIGFKTVPNVNPDKAALEVFQNLLFNESETGRLNKLQRENKVLFAGCVNYSLNDDGALLFFIVPKLFGQSFNAAEKLLFDEVTKIKQGNISDTDLLVTKTGLYRQRQQEIENCQSRTLAIVQSFSRGTNWDDELNYNKQIEKITKEDVVRVANQYFGENYFALHSKTGFPKKEILKKPDYKPAVNNQKEESDYAKAFNQIKTAATDAKFLDFDKDVAKTTLNSSNMLYVTKNPINDIFTLKVEYTIGSDSAKNLNLVPDIFSYFFTKNRNAEKLKQEFAMLGLTYWAKCEDSRFSITFTGLDANLVQSVKLINDLLNNTVVSDKAIKQLQSELIASRKLNENMPQTMGNALYEYARLGSQSDFINRISKKELKKIKPDEILSVFQKAISYNAVWHYVGNQSVEAMKGILLDNITLADNKKELPLVVKNNMPITENIIYLYNDKKAVQSQIHFLVNSNNYAPSPELNARVSAFNLYMAGGFSGLILQEIREYRSMAYTANGYFATPTLPNKPSYFTSYIGTQADKTNSAIDIMDSLICSMPQKPERIEAIKSLLKNSTSAKYPDFRSISSSIDNLRQCGYSSSPLRDEYARYEALSFDDIMSFYTSYIKNKPIVITIYGNKSKIDLAKLAKYGKIVELKKNDIILE